MSVAIITKEEIYQKVLEQALLPLDVPIAIYGDIAAANFSKHDLFLYVLESSDDVENRQFIAENDVFLIHPVPFLDESGRFSAVFEFPVRLGRITQAVKYHLQLKQRNKDLIPVKMGDYTLDPKSNTLIWGGDTVKLTEKEQDMLLFFYQNKEKTVSREELLEHVWGYAEGVETHTLETHIYRLRQKIEKDPVNPQFLMTDDVGYRLNF